MSEIEPTDIKKAVKRNNTFFQLIGSTSVNNYDLWTGLLILREIHWRAQKWDRLVTV